MTHPLGDERDALGLEDDFLTVEQLAQLRQVTPAAVRAQLRAGNLAGQQVLQGQRTVWRIPVSAAQRYLDRQGAASPTAERDPAVSRSGMPREAEPPPEESTDPEPARPAAAPTPPAAGGSAS